MNNLEACQEKVEEVMRLFARRLLRELVGPGEPGSGRCPCSPRGQRLPVHAALGGGPHYFLRALSRGRATVSEMAAELGVTLAAVTALANKLVRTGWIGRYRDERDRRVVWLELTAEGREVLARAQAARREVFKRYFGGLSGEEVAALCQIMKKVLAKLQQEL
uniref:MarR family transcriptional regulator n=1 Tax=Ammonifex degensii TaxID=42838 RepID=A0A7C2EJT1_9THEO